MTTFRASGRLVTGWFIVALATLCQAPRIYGDGEVDPNCPTCAAKGQLGRVPQMPVNALAPEFAQQELPPHEGAPQGEFPVAPAEPECPVPMVRLKVRAPACAEVGKEMEYRVKVENCSPLDAHNVTVRMNLPASVKVLRASPQVHQREPELQWNLGTMPGHGCHDIVVMIVPLGLADIKNCTRVTFEHGQCVTTKVVAFAPEGSADGRVPPGTIPGAGGPGGVGPGGVGPGGNNPASRDGFEVKVFGPAEVAAGQPATYKITVFNKSDRPIFGVGANLTWSDELELIKQSDDLVNVGGLRAWPKPLIDVLAPGASRSLDLTFRLKPLGAPGRHCVKATATASLTANPLDNKTSNVTDEACTEFRRAGIPGMTLEMTDRDDPILKNGEARYPIVVRNQGTTPITNLTVKARVPELLELVKVYGPGKYASGPKANREFWVEYEPFAVLAVGQEQTFEIVTKGRGQVGDARFHVEFTADQVERLPNGEMRWIVEEESTTIVPDEETRARIREISRRIRSKEKLVPGTVTSGK